MDNPTQAHIRSLRNDLLNWYAKHHRQLPWRVKPGELGDPYQVLVSETMLQQTQVATVIDYFQRFMASFPDVHSLAAASEQQVLRMWQGLGYYRRARNLHAAARVIVSEHDGRAPEEVRRLLTLPGVGPYTAGAIASIAFAQPAPILDGNVARVLARWFCLPEAIDQTAGKKRLWTLSEAMVAGMQRDAQGGKSDPELEATVPDSHHPAFHAGDLNQAMMELGALICTPRQPQCGGCPVAAHCQARQQSEVEQYPIVTPRRKPQSVAHHILAIQRGNRYLFHQRPSQGLWSNMWQLPTAEQDLSAAKLMQWAGDQSRLKVTRPKKVAQFRHQTTHRTIQFQLWQAKATGGRLPPKFGQWRKLSDTADLPLPNPQLRALKLLQQHEAGPTND